MRKSERSFRTVLLIAITALASACSSNSQSNLSALSGMSIVSKGSLAELSAKQKSTVSGSAVMFKAAFNNLCIEYKNDSLVQDTCSSTNALENFTLTAVGNYSQISAPGLTGECLQDNGWDIKAVGCSTSTNQQWSQTPVTNGVNIVNLATSRCINVAGNSSTIGGQLISYPCDGGGNEQFVSNGGSAVGATPAPVTSSGQLINVVFNGLCLEYKNNALIQDSCSSVNPLQSFVFNSSGTISAPGVAGDCLQDNGWDVVAAACSTASIQQWSQKSASNVSSVSNVSNGINLVNAGTSRCINIAGNSSSIGGQVISYQCDGGGNEQLKLGSNSSTVAATPTPTPLPTATPTPVPVLAATPTPASGQFVQVVFNSLCLELKSGNLVQDTCSTSNAAQLFVFNSAGTISAPLLAGQCLQDNSGTIQAAVCSTASTQQWSKATAAKGINLVNLGTSRCINIAGNSTSIGGQVITYACDGGGNEQLLITASAVSSVPTPAPATPTPIPATPVPTPAATATPTASLPAAISGQNYVMSFDDEFTSLNTISSGSVYNGAKWYNGTEQCCMSDTSGGLPAVMYPSAVSGVSVDPYSLISGGGLNITLSKQNNVWYSGVMTSVDNSGQGFSQQYGYFEVSAKLSGDPGTWPSFWMLNTAQKQGNSTNVGEIDVFESYGNWSNGFCTTFHDWSGGTTPYYNCGISVPNTLDGFHKYGMLWTADTMTIYFDDVQVAQTTTPAVMKQPYYMLLDQGLGGGWPTNLTPNSSALQVKYVRVYKQN